MQKKKVNSRAKNNIPKKRGRACKGKKETGKNSFAKNAGFSLTGCKKML